MCYPDAFQIAAPTADQFTAKETLWKINGSKCIASNQQEQWVSWSQCPAYNDKHHCQAEQDGKTKSTRQVLFLCEARVFLFSLLFSRMYEISEPSLCLMTKTALTPISPAGRNSWTFTLRFVRNRGIVPRVFILSNTIAVSQKGLEDADL